MPSATRIVVAPNPLGETPGVHTEKIMSPMEKELASRVSKRIIVCCDGTWQDGVIQKRRWQYSNVLKMSRMMNHQDDRQDPPTPQIVFYQAGVGSEHNIYAEYIEGATGASLAEKVQEAYAFIAHNYQLGDDIYLFGFSRGAYTARMTASFIAEIGVLDRKDMDHFADIFLAYQKLGNTTNEKVKARCRKILEPFTRPDAKGRVRADADGDTFTVKCIGLFDTVGSIGLPEELTFSPKLKRLFGFPDNKLGTHIEHAFHAMALHETRADFNVNKFEQTKEGRAKGQILKQVWFPGSHSDVGGGWQAHDLADISLAWMASNVESMLSLDLEYLRDIPRPVAPWGGQLAHDPRTGIFRFGHSLHRTLPIKTDDITCEYFHPSVMFQVDTLPQVEQLIRQNPALMTRLKPLEEIIKDVWPYVPGSPIPDGENAEVEDMNFDSETWKLWDTVKGIFWFKTEAMDDEGGKPRYEDTWLGAIVHEIQSPSDS